jgi:prepilin-type processing-associated H-X9-DG protein
MAAHRTNWGVALLPYLEEQNVYDRYDNEADNTAPVNAFAREQYIPTYACPSDLDQARGTEVPGWGLAKVRNAYFQFGSYRGMAGRSADQYFNVPDYGVWTNYEGWRNMPWSWRGVFHVVVPRSRLDHCESFNSISDGLSNTIAIGERHRPADVPRVATFWAYGSGMLNSNAFPYSVSLEASPYNKCLSRAVHSKLCSGGWSSYHPTGLNWLMCDGSVHFLSKNMDMDILGDMSTIAGGEPGHGL